MSEDGIVQKVRESSTVAIDVGEFNLSDIEGCQTLVNQALLTGIASLVARGFDVAKIKLNLKTIVTD